MIGSKGRQSIIGFCHFSTTQELILDKFALSPRIGNLSKDVFERRTSTGSEAFSLLICLDANKFVLLSFFSLIKTIYTRVSTEPLPNDAKSPLPVDVRRSKTLLLKLPILSEGKGASIHRLHCFKLQFVSILPIESQRHTIIEM